MTMDLNHLQVRTGLDDSEGSSSITSPNCTSQQNPKHRSSFSDNEREILVQIVKNTPLLWKYDPNLEQRASTASRRRAWHSIHTTFCQLCGIECELPTLQQAWENIRCAWRRRERLNESYRLSNGSQTKDGGVSIKKYKFDLSFLRDSGYTTDVMASPSQSTQHEVVQYPTQDYNPPIKMQKTKSSRDWEEELDTADLLPRHNNEGVLELMNVLDAMRGTTSHSQANQEENVENQSADSSTAIAEQSLDEPRPRTWSVSVVTKEEPVKLPPQNPEPTSDKLQDCRPNADLAATQNADLYESIGSHVATTLRTIAQTNPNIAQHAVCEIECLLARVRAKILPKT